MVADALASSTQKITPALYVVATPIGNLGDITMRALSVLRAADIIACEDTRHTARLASHFGLAAQMVAVHQHNERESAQRLIDAVSAGKVVALVSDAGTPAVSDPGARVVRVCQEAGCAVVPLPGPSAVVTALSASGLLDDHFVFVGFLPNKQAARRAAIRAWANVPAALVFYESPHRIVDAVADLAVELEPTRELVIAREITKTFEQIVRLPLAQAADWLAADDNRQRGEFVLLVSAPPERAADDLDAHAEKVLGLLLSELPLKSASRLASEITGASRNALYARALQIKATKQDDEADES